MDQNASGQAKPAGGLMVNNDNVLQPRNLQQNVLRLWIMQMSRGFKKNKINKIHPQFNHKNDCKTVLQYSFYYFSIFS